MSLDTRASPRPRATALVSAKKDSLPTHEALGPMLVRGLFTRWFLLLLLPPASCFCSCWDTWRAMKAAQSSSWRVPLPAPISTFVSRGIPDS